MKKMLTTLIVMDHSINQSNLNIIGYLKNYLDFPVTTNKDVYSDWFPS